MMPLLKFNYDDASHQEQDKAAVLSSRKKSRSIKSPFYGRRRNSRRDTAKKSVCGAMFQNFVGHTIACDAVRQDSLLRDSSLTMPDFLSEESLSLDFDKECEDTEASEEFAFTAPHLPAPTRAPKKRDSSDSKPALPMRRASVLYPAMVDKRPQVPCRCEEEDLPCTCGAKDVAPSRPRKRPSLFLVEL